MVSAKEEVRKLLDTLPDSSSFEDIQYHIYIREKVGCGLRAVEENRILSEDEAEQRLSKWLAE